MGGASSTDNSSGSNTNNNNSSCGSSNNGSGSNKRTSSTSSDCTSSAPSHPRHRALLTLKRLRTKMTSALDDKESDYGYVLRVSGPLVVGTKLAGVRPRLLRRTRHRTAAPPH